MNFFAGIEKALLSIAGQRSLSIQLDITNACNLSCAHCYHSDHKNLGNLRMDDWHKVLDQYQSLLKILKAKPNIAICGGEPLTSPNLVPLLDEITNRWNSSFVGVMTNGTRVPQVIERVSSYPLYFQVSLESCYESAHDQIRGPGSFRAAISGIKLLKERGFDVNLLVILSERTSMETAAMFEFAKGLGVDSLNYTRAIPEGTGKTYFSGSDRPLTGDALKNAIQAVIDHSKISGVRTNTDKPLFNLLDQNAGFGGKPGFQGLVVGYKGDIKVSSRADLVLGNIKTTDLESVFFKHPLYRSLRKGEILKCGDCKFFSRCGGDRNFAYATTGNFLGPDNGCWLN